MEYLLYDGKKFVEDNPLTDYYVLLHDFEWRGLPRSLDDEMYPGLPNDKGYPEMVPLRIRKGVQLTSQLQWFWFDLCMLKKYSFTDWKRLPSSEARWMVNQWGALTDSGRFATNNTGTDKHANYVANRILGEPLKSGLPKQWEVLCGGNVVKAKNHTPLLLGGEPYIEIEVWDGKNPYPDPYKFNWSTHPHLIHMSTISTPFPKGNVWKVDPFPFFGGVGSPYAVLSSSPQYIKTERIRRLRKSELFPSPYV